VSQRSRTGMIRPGDAPGDPAAFRPLQSPELDWTQCTYSCEDEPAALPVQSL
jgi:hypothetical protein